MKSIYKRTLVLLFFTALMGTQLSPLAYAESTASQDFIALPRVVLHPGPDVSTDTNVQWDFNNDGTIDSSERDAAQVFPGAGTYKVKMLAGDQELVKRITIDECIENSEGSCNGDDNNSGGEDENSNNSNWASDFHKFRRKLTFKDDVTLTDFPIAITLNHQAHVLANIESDCSDLMVTDSDGKTRLSMEVATCLMNNEKNRVEIFFKAPQTGLNKEFYLYYGLKEGTIRPAVVFDGRNEDVWSNNYVAVYHMTTKPGKHLPDSTSYRNHGTGTAGFKSNAPARDGRLGMAVGFNGVNQAFIIPDSDELVLTGDFTLSTTFRRQNLEKFEYLISKGWDPSGNSQAFGWAIGLHNPKSGQGPNINGTLSVGWHFRHPTIVMNSNTNINVSEWATSTLVSSEESNIRLHFTNEVKDAQSKIDQQVTPTSAPLSIGVGYNSTQGWFKGIIDEVRISNVARSDEWITTESKSIMNWDHVISIGTEVEDSSSFGAGNGSGTGGSSSGGSSGGGDTGSGSDSSGGDNNGDDGNDDSNTNPATWYNSAWAYRSKLTTHINSVKEDLTDFPVYVDLSDMPAIFFGTVKDDGADIRITSADGQTELAREVVFIDKENQTGELHFKANSLLKGKANEFYIYFGNSQAVEPAVSSLVGAESVWTNNYAAVLHLNEDPNSDVDGYKDSTLNHNHGKRSAVESDAIAKAKLGRGQILGGANKFIHIQNSESLDARTNLTVSIWARNASPTLTKDSAELISKYDFGAGQREWDIRLIPTSGRMTSFLGTNNGTSFISKKALIDVASLDQWNYYAILYSPTKLDLVINGEEVGTEGSINLPSSLAPSKTDVVLGANLSKGIGNDLFSGALDEARIATTTRSEAWMKTAFINQNSPSSFYAITDLESQATQNPESQIDQWSAVSNAQVTESDMPAPIPGQTALKVKTNGKNTYLINKQAFDISPGDTYKGQLYVKGAAGQRLDLRLARYGSTKYEASHKLITLTGTWQRVEIERTYQNEHSYARLDIGTPIQSNPTEFYIWGGEINKVP